MRLTDRRYAREKEQLELVLRMIGHEARTCTIRRCTGLSDDRIRKVYSVYFKADGRRRVRRQRGKSPTQTAIYVKSVLHQLEATTLAKLCMAAGAVASDGARLRDTVGRRSLAFGRRMCRAYEAYRVLYPRPRFSLERAFALIEGLSLADELALRACSSCDDDYVHDPLSLDALLCPCCRLKGLPPASGRRRPAASAAPTLAGTALERTQDVRPPRRSH